MAQALQASSVSVVYGHRGEVVRQALKAEDVAWVEQAEQLGTGHAVKQALPTVKDDALVLVLLWGRAAHPPRRHSRSS